MKGKNRGTKCTSSHFYNKISSSHHVIDTVISAFGNNVQTYLKENYYVLSKLEQCNDHFINLKLYTIKFLINNAMTSNQ